MKDILLKVQSAFEANGEIDAFYVTSDGQCFESKSFAVLHSKSLTDEKVQLFSRSFVEKALELPSADASDGNKAKQPTKAEIEARLKEEFGISADDLKGKNKADLEAILEKCIQDAKDGNGGSSGQ